MMHNQHKITIPDLVKRNSKRFRGVSVETLNHIEKAPESRTDHWVKTLVAVTFISFVILFIGCSSDVKSESPNNVKSESPNNTNSYKTTTATCDFCGKTFTKNSGFMLSGHPQVFCSQNCSTNWAWQHNIGVY